MYNEPDFVAVKLVLKINCEAHSFCVLFLPNFHCELNFIKQCWVAAKRTYQKYPTSSKECDLQANLIDIGLCVINLNVTVCDHAYLAKSISYTLCRFARRSRCFKQEAGCMGCKEVLGPLSLARELVR